MANTVHSQIFMVIFLNNDVFFKNRNKGFKSPINSIFIYAEGKTEKVYTNDFNLLLNKTNYRIYFKDFSTDINKLIDKAEKLIKKELIKKEKDSVWIIFDYEDTKFTNSEIIKIYEKVKKINKFYFNKLHVVISNPCFELWFLLHFDQQLTTSVTNIEVLDKLNCYISNYKKGKSYFLLLEQKLDFAIKNAKRLQEIHKKEGKEIYEKSANPCTTVNQFTEFILNCKNLI